MTVTGDGATAGGSTPPRPGPARTTVLVGISVVLGTALLLWGADRLARWGAEAALAQAVQEATGIAERPSVQVHGGFFLLQAVQGRYDDVGISVREVSSGPMSIDSVEARLTGVHVSFHDLLVRDPGPVWIERSVGEAFLGYDDLNRYLEITGRPVTVGPAPGGEVRLTGTVGLLGRPISASALAQLSPRGGALAISPTAVDTGTPLAPASRLLLGQRFALLVPLDPLPFGQELTAIEAGQDGLVVQVQGTDVVVRP
ncbi:MULTISPECIES: LmeA family phospholipid-binding protein [unclassified Modestobacter]